MSIDADCHVQGQHTAVVLTWIVWQNTHLLLIATSAPGCHCIDTDRPQVCVVSYGVITIPQLHVKLNKVNTLECRITRDMGTQELVEQP